MSTKRQHKNHNDANHSNTNSNSNSSSVNININNKNNKQNSDSNINNANDDGNSDNINKNNNDNDNGNSNRNKNKNKQKHPQNIKLTEKERLPLQHCISDFLTSGENELVLPGLTNVQRKYLHEYASRIGLKTRSHGGQSNRVLHITRRQRPSSLGDVRKLELPAATRRLLAEMVPSMHAQLTAANRAMAPQSFSQSRIRSLMQSLGPRMVPPRANRISKELFQDKQELPIFRFQNDIVEMLKQHAIFIINGDTGSGKTTQVPQYILEDHSRRGRSCRIIVSQPRRVAAVSVAQRVAEERGEQLGETVGYQIRMESRMRKSTNLIYTTSGCLLRSIMSDTDDYFRKVTHLIIDEIHDRDKHTDFTLISVKDQLRKNKNLKVILMSATMDINLLSKYFDDCPVLNVPGQGYDVKIFHLEDILYHSGYRTALMEKYLRSMIDFSSMQNAGIHIDHTVDHLTAEESAYDKPPPLIDEHLQQLLDNILDQCVDIMRNPDDLGELFDQIQYYIESEGMPVDAAHTANGLTPLMAACKCNYPKYVQLFMQRQANLHARDVHGCSAADYARVHVDGQCLRVLKSGGGGQFHQLSMHYTQEQMERERLLNAYQQQFNDDYDVDHDLILSLIEGLYRSVHPGAIMVFLPGYNDIVQQRDLINSTLPSGTYRICILHGQMDSQDQVEALQRQRVRKIILSTNIGQTSITIPDLAYIIDCGKVKMKSYDTVTESSQLQSVWISQADACQRSGRAGRTQNGVCYRLYSQAKYHFMPKFEFPEFMRIPLTEICLYAKTLDKSCQVQAYLSRALSPPSSLSVQNAIRKLQLLGVFNADESVTELGQHLVDIPLDVQLGKCLLYSVFLKCFDPILTIVAFHSVKDPFTLPSDRAAQGQASFQRKSFAGQSFSDQRGILELYKAYVAVRHSRKRVREFCNKHFLSQSAMELFCATRRQIADVVSHKFRLGQATLFNEDWNMVRFCLAVGFYPNVAVVDRVKMALICGSEKQLIVQRTSALNPPGMKSLKEFVQQLPHDWIVFFEKSRVCNMCSINMNTVVSPVMVALQCGRQCVLEEDECSDDDSDLDSVGDEDDAEFDGQSINERQLSRTLKTLALEVERSVTMSLDSWIKFQLSASDAKMLVLLRTLLQTQFQTLLRHNQSPQNSTAPYSLQKVLTSLEQSNCV